MSTGFQRHGSEMSGEFVILLRYEMSELWETGRGCRNAGCGSCGKESECFTT